MGPSCHSHRKRYTIFRNRPHPENHTTSSAAGRDVRTAKQAYPVSFARTAVVAHAASRPVHPRPSSRALVLDSSIHQFFDSSILRFFESWSQSMISLEAVRLTRFGCVVSGVFAPARRGFRFASGSASASPSTFRFVSSAQIKPSTH